jgi:hypothetical protein
VKSVFLWEFVGGLSRWLKCVLVTVSIEKPTQDDFLELARLHAKFQTLENDLDLDRELQQLGVFLVLHNQENASNINQGDEGFIRTYKDVENCLSGVHQGREALLVMLQQLEASAVEEETEHSGLAEYLAQKGYHQ